MYYLQLFTVTLGLLVLTSVSLSAQQTARVAAPEQQELMMSPAKFVESLGLTAEQEARNQEFIELRDDQLASTSADNPRNPARVKMLHREVHSLYLNRLNDVLDEDQRARLLAYRKQLR